MKRQYSFEKAQLDALKGGPEPKPVKIDAEMVDWVITNMLTHSYEGRTYKAPSGQWSWAIAQDGVDIQAGGGYASEDDAREALEEGVAIYEERAHQVRQMVANSRLEGIEPSTEDKELHQEYIAGRATLDDLHNHAIAFALIHSVSNSNAAQEQLAAGNWACYYDDYLVPDVILREWPDGRMEEVEIDAKGNVFVVRELPEKSELRKRRDAIRAALANVQLSGGYPSKEMVDRMESYATSKLTWDEFFNGSVPDPAA